MQPSIVQAGSDARVGAPAPGERDSASSRGEDTTLLDVRRLSVDYGSGAAAAHAVVDVSLTLGRGEILGLAGESGSGKSTLAHAVSRLLRPPARVTHGEALYYPASAPETPGTSASAVSPGAVDPVDVLALSPAELQAFRWRQLAIVFQSAMNALNPVLDIGTQITDVLAAHDPRMSRASRQERAAELLRIVGIAPDRLRSFPHELSGGMRQRATIAIALALNPSLIIMDEPTTALDVVVQREILSEIADLQTRFGFSVIFITHDLSLLLEIADRVAIMYAGRIVELATVAQLRAAPQHPYTRGLLRSFPKIRGPRITLASIPGSPPDLRALPSGCAFHPRCAQAFEACRNVVPVLNASPSGGCVACHLYDAELARARDVDPAADHLNGEPIGADNLPITGAEA